MTSFDTIKLKISDRGIARITLNRGDIHNAFDSRMIQELTQVFTDLAEKTIIRIIILTGEGRSFSAGADINYMKKSQNYSYQENYDDAARLENLFHTIYSSPKPVVCRINGSAIGGGIGLVSSCDIAVAVVRAKFAFSEVNLGILPAVISPYVIQKIGFSYARRYFLTGERFTAQRALEIGLIQELASDEKNLDIKVNEIVDNLLTSGPVAIKEVKKLLKQNWVMDLHSLRKYCIEAIAAIRTSDEGREGLAAFLEKRDSYWKTGSLNKAP
ncbi:MAG: enoyl-CoA hydratase-related protein [Candidatus Heimdallarchaeota archaeon]